MGVRLPYVVVIALVIGLALLLSVGSWTVQPHLVDTPAGAAPTATSLATNFTTELNLTDGQDFVAPGISYQGLYNGVNTSFPVLLTGSADSQFWSLDQSVLEMAPQVSYVYGHDAGLMMFQSGDSTQWEITTDAVTSANYNGDGVSDYFMLTPVSNSSWNSDAYYATVTDGPSLALCSGDVIFPYSATPYFIVQWDPAYEGHGCAAGTVGQFNVFSVNPSPGGVVTASSIVNVLSAIGNRSANEPSSNDAFNVTVGYKAAENEMEARAIDTTTNETLAYASLDMVNATYLPPDESSIPSYLAVAEGAYSGTAWGLEYVGYATWTQSPSGSEPLSFLTPPFEPATSPGTGPGPGPGPVPPTRTVGPTVGVSDLLPRILEFAVPVVVVGMVAALVVLPIRQRQLRREGEELVAGMEQEISQGRVPPRTP